jgi:predicted glycosyltransferase
MRFLLYSHDGMGLGHVRRHLAIAAALTSLAPDSQVLLATSVDEVSSLGLPPNVDTLKLPGLRKLANEQYASRRLTMAPSEIRALRSALLETAVRSFRPDVVVVDKHPFGVGGEFRAGLEAARRSGARAVLGLRDILDEPGTVLREWDAEHLRDVIPAWYDLVLVYGVPAVFDAVEEYQLPPALAQRTKYCGYVVNQPVCRWNCEKDCDWLPPAGERVVLGTTGGGEDGAAILKTFIQASAGAPWRAVAVAGPMMSEDEFKELQQLAVEVGVVFTRFVPCLANFFWILDGLVCMGGYNTLVEAVFSGIPTVCVPRVFPRQEQLLRSQAFERLGLVRNLHPRELTPNKLRTALNQALQTPRQVFLDRAGAALDFDGTQKAAAYMLNLKPAGANGRHSPRVPSAERDVARVPSLGVGVRT